jgi:seryl-tRNA synthetase
MLDIKLLRENVESVSERLKARGFQLQATEFSELEQQRKSLQVETEELQSKRNTLSKSIGQAKAKGEEVDDLLEQVNGVSSRMHQLKSQLDEVLAKQHQWLLSIPNLPDESVPLGASEEDNVEIKRVGLPPAFDFTAKSHDELGLHLGMMDFSLAAKITGSRYVVLRNDLVRLQRALTAFMLETHTKEHGYEELYVPYIVNRDSLTGSGQLPKFEDDLFKLSGEHEHYLTSTGEVPLVNMVRDVIIDEKELPIKFVSHTPCFRSEAGSYGRDTKGMIRQHQFEKVELVWISDEKSSFEALENLRSHAESILQSLGLAYRVVALCGGDLSFTSTKTYDLEVYLPSQETYREISSCSNCLSYQARRMQTRYRIKGEKKTHYVHTLNGSGLAVGRTLVAVMENYQDKDGNIRIPSALQPYMGGQTIIKKG